MKRHHLLLFTLSILTLTTCKSLRELKNLTKCQFRVATVKDIALAGVSIQTIRRFSDLKLKDAAKVGAALAAGNLPLTMTVNLEAKNPNKQLAAINRLEWVAMVDEFDLLEGIIGDRVEIQPEGGVATIPLAVTCNLRSVLKTLGKDELLNFGMGMVDASDRPTRVALKLRPTIMVGKHPLTYPGWFTVKREFAAQ
jgi:hypothetical protein